ncbi:hypothetical protein BMF94_1980 [Rhodotorula taiwanensis]|uniref:glutaminase n=1 Tax=Rhodotorula taiwanensis TaxID=741276 RepID=A0A2S5BE08_9BASI|nr:hypothetical protein BMF94_1980 [Rhodotorula taiwanensis]
MRAPTRSAIGVLSVKAHLEWIELQLWALQGSFAEHIHALESLPEAVRLPVVQVRTPQDLARCRGLIIPGGESTTIALLIMQSGLYEPLLDFVELAKRGTGERSIWGTCAGSILLAKEIDGPTTAGWKGLHGMDVRVSRNRFGRQLQSFAHPLALDFLSPPRPPLLATFIRAPALHSILPLAATSVDSSEANQSPSAQPPPVECLVRLPPALLASVAPPKPALGNPALAHPTPAGPENDVVMWKQGDLLASSWHPELNKDDARVHEWWVRAMVLHQDE